MALDPGDVFAGYRILRRVGVGGMGTVYLAEHPRLPRRDALKVLSAELGNAPEFRRRFEREAALAARLEHPHIVSVYDCGVEGDRLWIAMRYVDGIDAAELIRNSPAGIPIERVIGIIDGAARGLDAAHRRNLLHRDVKPANILVGTRDDGSDDVRVADFGIARALDETGGVTSTGTTPATLAYAAPEQFDDRPLDHRVDVYALGCTLFHLLTGTPPFAGRSTAATIHAHLFEPPPRPSLLRADLPAAMDDVIAGAMAKDPNARFGSCPELAAAAAAAIRFPPAAHQALTFPPAPHEVPAFPPAAHPAPAFPSAAHRATALPPTPSPAATLHRSAFHPPPATTSRRPPWLIPAALAAVVLVIAGIGGAVWVTRSAGSSTGTLGVGDGPVTSTSATGSAGTTTESTGDTTTATPPGTTESVSADQRYSAWGPAAYIVAAFPDLLPADPEGSGYQGIRCGLNDDQGSWLHCRGDDDSDIYVNIRCDPQRNPMPHDRSLTGVTDIREETWSRPSGTGSVWWASDSMSGSGLLSVFFDDPDRSFCIVGASGGSGGQDLYDRWWTGAPI